MKVSKRLVLAFALCGNSFQLWPDAKNSGISTTSTKKNPPFREGLVRLGEQTSHETMKTLLTNKYKKITMRKYLFLKFFKITLISSFLLALSSNSAKAQNEEFKQLINAFVEAKSADFEKKDLNVTEPDLGQLPNTNHIYRSFFVLRASEKSVNNIGNRSKLKLNCSFYAYENAEEKDYALSYWFKNFMEGQRITVGRTVRTYKNAQPTIIVINATNICIMSFDCKNYDLDLFRDLKKDMLTYFGDDDSMVIEIRCEGPLDWTKNPPDPKDPKWRK